MNLPRNEMMEQMVLAGMMNNEECFYHGVSFLDDEHFTRDEYIYIFQELQSEQELQSARLLEGKIKDPRTKSAVRMTDTNWTSKDDFYAAVEQLKKDRNKRELFYAVDKVVKTFDTIDPKEAAESIYDVVMRLELEQSNTDILKPEELGKEYLERLYEKFENPEESMGIPYSVTSDSGFTAGLPSLDQMFNGAQGGDLIMLAAKTGVGKTAFAINLARIFSVYQNYRGYYANTEMSEDEMISRLLAPVANVQIKEMLYGRIEGSAEEQKEKRRRMTAAVDNYYKGKLVLSRIAYLPLYKLTGLSRQVKRLYGELDYLIVDYVGRMDVDDNKNLWDELYRITKGLKQLAVELDIPVFMLAQRNEEGFIEGAKKMKNECDGVLLIEPVSDGDSQFIENYIDPQHSKFVNYKILKDKVRRSDNSYPIYCMFDKSRGIIQEARRR